MESTNLVLCSSLCATFWLNFSKWSTLVPLLGNEVPKQQIRGPNYVGVSVWRIDESNLQVWESVLIFTSIGSPLKSILWKPWSKIVQHLLTLDPSGLQRWVLRSRREPTLNSSGHYDRSAYVRSSDTRLKNTSEGWTASNAVCKRTVWTPTSKL